MWIFAKDGKSWTCPDSSLIQIARIQASDREDAIKNSIVNNETAKAYLEKFGFEVTHIEEEPLKEIPKYADFYNKQHWDLYNKLNCKPDSELTKEERDFCIRMYHAEEFACGLDGDR